MKQSAKKNRVLLKSAKLAVLVLAGIGFVLSGENFSKENLIKNQIEKEKLIGDKELNQKLYLYNDQFHVDKYIATDYQYLAFLPILDKYSMQFLLRDTGNVKLVFTDKTVGYILWTPYNAKILPEYIETGIKSGQYKEIFNYNGYRFIKIR
jgi:hypothetical protein